MRPELHVPSKQPVIPQPDVIHVGEKMNKVVSSVPLSLAVNLENAVCHAVVSQSCRLVFGVL